MERSNKIQKQEASPQTVLSPTRSPLACGGAETIFKFKPYVGKTFIQVIRDHPSYCIWLASKHAYGEFVYFVSQLDEIAHSWDSEDRTRWHELVANTKWSKTPRETPVLYRDALLLVFERVKSFYDLFSSSQVCRQWRSVSKHTTLLPWNGLEGWGCTLVSFGKHKGHSFNYIFRNEKKYLQWLTEQVIESNRHRPSVQLVHYSRYKNALAETQRKMQEKQHKKRKKESKKERKRIEAQLLAPSPEISCKCFENVDDCESLYVQCDGCNMFSHARCYYASFSSIPEHFICQSCINAMLFE